MRGKEDLHASKRARLALGYTFLGALNFQLSGGYLWDGIMQVIRLDPVTNRGSYTYENAEKTWSLRLLAPLIVVMDLGAKQPLK